MFGSSRIVSPAALLSGPDGTQLIALLAQWFVNGEGLADGRASEIEHGRAAVAARYPLHLLATLVSENGITPRLQERRAYAQVHAAYLAWAADGEARELVEGTHAAGAVLDSVTRLLAFRLASEFR